MLRFLPKTVQIYLSDNKNVIFIVNKIPAIPGQCVQWHHRVYVVILMDIEWKCGDWSVATGQTDHSHDSFQLWQTAFKLCDIWKFPSEIISNNHPGIVQLIPEMTDICILCRPLISAGHLLLGPVIPNIIFDGMKNIRVGISAYNEIHVGDWPSQARPFLTL